NNHQELAIRHGKTDVFKCDGAVIVHFRQVANLKHIVFILPLFASAAGSAGIFNELECGEARRNHAPCFPGYTISEQPPGYWRSSILMPEASNTWRKGS